MYKSGVRIALISIEKTLENVKFEFPSHTFAEMFEKANAKCNHATIRVASIENTLENQAKNDWDTRKLEK